MDKNDIINIEDIPKSPQRESSYKKFPIPQIIQKKNKKIFLLPRIKNLKALDFDIEKDITNDIGISRKKNSKEKEISFVDNSKNKRLNSEKSKKIIHTIEINSKKYPKLISLSKNKSKINNIKFKSLLNQNISLNMNKEDLSSINNKSSCKKIFGNDLPKIMPLPEKPKFVFRSRMSKLKPKPLESVIHEIDSNNIHTIHKEKDNIFKTTDAFPNIKIGSKYNPEDVNSFEEEEKVEFNENLKNILEKLNLKKIRTRNNRERNCYEILTDLRKKKVYNCQKLIEKTSDEVRIFKEQLDSYYNKLRKSFEQNDDWNNLNNK